MSCHVRGCQREATHKCNLCGLARYCDADHETHREAYDQHLEFRCMGVRIAFDGVDTDRKKFGRPPSEATFYNPDEKADAALPFVLRRLQQIIPANDAQLNVREQLSYFSETLLPMLELLASRALAKLEPLEEEAEENLQKYAEIVAPPAGVQIDRQRVFVYNPDISIDENYRVWNLTRQEKGFSELSDSITLGYTELVALRRVARKAESLIDRLREPVAPKAEKPTESGGRRTRAKIDAEQAWEEYAEEFSATVAAQREWLQNLVDSIGSLEELVGMDSLKAQVAKLIMSLFYNGRQLLESKRFFNVVIFGEPGTGKTEVATRVGPILYYLGVAPVLKNTIVTSATDWVAAYEGQTQGKAKSRFLQGLGSTTQIDEAYSLVRPESEKGYGAQALAQIIQDMDIYRGFSVMILSGYEADMRKNLYATNDGLERRIPYIWRIQPYTPDELAEIIRRAIARRDDLAFESVVDADPWDAYTDTKYNLGIAHRAGAFQRKNGGGAQQIIAMAIDVAGERMFKDPAQRAMYKGFAGRTRLTDDVLSEAVMLYAYQNAADRAGRLLRLVV